MIAVAALLLAQQVAFTSRVAIVTTDPKGKVTNQPPIAAYTVVRGDTARAEIIEGVGDFKVGDVLLTHDHGRTLYLVKPAKKQYTVIHLDSMGIQLGAAMNDGSLHAAADSITVAFERPGPGHTRLARSFRLTVRLLLFKKRIQTSETIDRWDDPVHSGVTDPLGGMFRALLDAPSHADPGIARSMGTITDNLSTGTPTRMVHSLVTGAPGDAATTVTTLEATGFAPSTDAVAFAVPAGYRKSDK